MKRYTVAVMIILLLIPLLSIPALAEGEEAEGLTDEDREILLSLGYSGPLDGGMYDDPPPVKLPDTELSVLQEIRDLLNVFYALAILGICILIVRYILRLGLGTFTKYTNF